MSSRYTVTVTSSRRDCLTLERGEYTTEELAQHFANYEVGEKDGEAVIPAVFAECPSVCRNAGKPKALDCGGSSFHRLGANVSAMTMLGADLDDITAEDFARIISSLRSRGLRFWWWHTYSHRLEIETCKGCRESEGHCEAHQPGTAQVRARILIPFAEPLPLQNARQWSRIAWPALMHHVGLPIAADPSCRDPARVYYLPRKPSAEAEREAGFHDGIELHWRAVLGDSLEKATVAEGNVKPAEPEDPTRPVDLDDVRTRLRRIRREGTKGLIARVLRGEPPTPAPEDRKPGDPSRYVAWLRLTGAIAAVAEDWEASEALMEIMRPSWMAEVQASPADHTEWETVEHLLETARAGIPALRAANEAARQAAKEVFLRSKAARRRQAMGGGQEGGAGGDRASTGPPEASAEDSDPESEPDQDGSATDRGPEGEEAEADAPSQDESVPDWVQQAVSGAGEDPDAWIQQMITNPPVKNGPPTFKNCAANVAIVLEHDPEWKAQLKYNELTKNVEDWRSGSPRPLIDADAVRVSTWLAQTYDLHQSDGIVWARLMTIARGNSYDPLADYLNSLAWDGVERLDNMLVRYFGARASEYTKLVGRRWMVSAAARGLSPGVQADTALVLEGLEQGEGKTSAGRILGGPFFASESIDFAAKDSLMIVSKSWICELGELDALRKSDITAQKQFLSKTHDDFRPPYGRVTESHPRRCAFIGTTNTDDYLQDETGNRRWWPVAAGAIDIRALAADRDQLWAEAVAIYRAADECVECPKSKRKRCAAHRWWMEDEERALVVAETGRRMAADVVAEAIEDWILKKEPAARPEVLRTLDITTEILRETPLKGVEHRIAKAMRRLNCPKWRDSKSKGYRLSEELRTAPRRAEKSLGMRIAGTPPAKA